jgi:hypothetical protein
MCIYESKMLHSTDQMEILSSRQASLLLHSTLRNKTYTCIVHTGLICCFYISIHRTVVSFHSNVHPRVMRCVLKFAHRLTQRKEK